MALAVALVVGLAVGLAVLAVVPWFTMVCHGVPGHAEVRHGHGRVLPGHTMALLWLTV